MPTAAPATPTPSVATPPPVHQGRKGTRLDDDYVNAIAAALKTLEKGNVVATGETYDAKTKARKAVELVRRELVRVADLKREEIGTRIWEADGAWYGGVHNRDAE